MSLREKAKLMEKEEDPEIADILQLLKEVENIIALDVKEDHF